MAQSPRLLVVAPAHRSLGEALGSSLSAVLRARAEGAAVLASSVVEGDDVLIAGARQLHSGTGGWRRATTGRAVSVRGRVVHHALALPSLTYFYGDASPRTLLNRNVRPFLAGYSRIGFSAQYFGRDFFSFARRPGAALGYDAYPDGSVLLEVFVGLDHPVLTDHSGQKPPVALEELGGVAEPLGLPTRVAQGMAEHQGAQYVEVELGPDALPELPQLPAPEPNAIVADAEVPIGAAFAVVRGARVWLRGDFLTSCAALDEAESLASGALERGEYPDETMLEPLATCPCDGFDPAVLLRLTRQAVTTG